VARVVLVVDDEPLVLHVTVGMLEDLGCEVIAATNGLEALEKLSAEPRVEVLITDINMPRYGRLRTRGSSREYARWLEGDHAFRATGRRPWVSSHPQTVFAKGPYKDDGCPHGPLLKQVGGHPITHRERVVLAFAEFFSNCCGGIADLVYRALKVVPRNIEVLGPILYLKLLLHRDLTSVGGYFVCQITGQYVLREAHVGLLPCLSRTS
jgi:hypothetical protein